MPGQQQAYIDFVGCTVAGRAGLEGLGFALLHMAEASISAVSSLGVEKPLLSFGLSRNRSPIGLQQLPGSPKPSLQAFTSLSSMSVV